MQAPFIKVDTAYQNRPEALKDLSLQQFSQLGNYVTQSDTFSAGDVGDLGANVKRVSLGIDYTLEDSGLKEGGALLGHFLGKLVGKEDVGASVGAQLPRGVVNTLPMMMSGGTLGLAGAFGLQGSDTFTQTNSVPRALFSGAAAALAPAVIGKVTPAVSNKLLGQGLTNRLGNALTANTALGVGSRFTGNLLDSFIYDTAVEAGDIMFSGGERSFSELGASDFWAAQAIGNVAFAPLDLTLAYRTQKAPKPESNTNALDAAKAIADAESAARNEKPLLLPYTPPRTDQFQLVGDPVDIPIVRNVTPPESLNKVAGLPYNPSTPALTAKLVENDIDVLNRTVEQANKPPNNPEQVAEQLLTVNQFRAMEGNYPVVDSIFFNRVAQHNERSKVFELSEDVVLQQEKNKTLIDIEAELSNSKAEGVQKVLETVNAIEGVIDPKVSRILHNRIKKHADDAQYVDLAIQEFEVWNKTSTDPAALGKRLDNMLKRHKRTVSNKTKTKAGRKNKVQDADLSTVFQRVEQLPKESQAFVGKAFSDFMNLADSVSISSTVTNRGVKVIHDWLGSNKTTEASLKGRFKKEFERIKMDEHKRAKRYASFDDTLDYNDIDYRNSVEGFEQDYNGQPDLTADYYDGNDGSLGERQAQLQLLRDGQTPSNAAALAPEVTRVARMFENITGQKVRVGELVGAAGNLLGLSSRSVVQNTVFLRKELQGNLAGFVAAHEILGHQLQKLYNLGQLDAESMKSYGRALDYVKELDTTQRGDLLGALARELLPRKLRLDLEADIRKTSNSVDETMANLSGLLAYASKNESNLAGIARFLPQQVYDFTVSAMKFLNKTLGSVKSLMGLHSLRGAKVESLPELSGFREMVFKSSKELVEQDASAKEFMYKLDAARVGGMGRVWDSVQMDAAGLRFKGNEAMNELADAMFLGDVKRGVTKFASRWGEGILHKLERYPVFKAIQSAMLFEHTYRHSLMRAGEVFMYSSEVKPNGKVVVPKDMGPVGRTYKDPVAFEKLNDIILYQQAKDINIFALEKSEPAEYGKLLQGLNDKQKGDVLETVARMQQLTKRMQDEILATGWKTEEFNVANLLRDHLEGSNQQVLDVARSLVKAHRANDGTFDTIAQGVGLDVAIPKTYLNAVSKLMNEKAQLYAQRSFFVSERRMKRYHVSYTETKGEPAGRRDFDTPEEALAFVKEARTNGWKVHYKGPGFKDTHEQFGGTQRQTDQFEAMFNAAQSKTVTSALEALQAAGKLSPEAFDAINQAQGQLMSALNAENVQATIGSIRPERKFRKGRETLNMLDQHLRYMSKVSITLPRLMTDAQMRFESKNPEILNNATHLEVLKEAKESLGQFRQPDSDLGRKITMGNFLHFLAFHLSSGLIEATQAPTNLSPKLMEEGAGLVESYTAPVAAMNSITKFNTTGKWNSKHTVKIKGKNVDAYQALLTRAEADGRIGLGLLQDVADAQHQVMTDLGRMSQGKQPLGKKLLTTAFGSVLNASSKFYGMFTGFNERVSLISAFELKSRQMFGDRKELTSAEFDSVYKEAVRVAGMANNSFGRADRPVGLFANNRTAAQAMYSLGSYNSGILSNFVRYYQKGFTKDIEGLTKAEKRAAKKALGMSLVGLASMAGLIGAIPLAGAGVALLEERTDLQPEAGLREWLFKLGNEIGDNETGNFVADAGMHGLAYALGAPMDFSSRVALGGILGFNSFEGWSPKALLGPTLSRASDYGNAALNVFKGDATGAVEKLLPVGVRKMFQLWTDNGSITDSNDKKLLDPTMWEQVSMAAGFTPTRVTARREAARMRNKQDRVRKNENAKFIKELKGVYQSQGPAAARNMLAQYSKDTGYNPASGLTSLVSSLQRDASGFDPRLTGALQGAEAQAQLLATFNPALIGNGNQLQNAQIDLTTRASMGAPRQNPLQRLQQASLSQSLGQDSNLPIPVLNQLAGQFLNPQAGFSNQAPNLFEAFANTQPR